MLLLSLIMLSLYIAPFITAHVQSQKQPQKQHALIYYRYFVIINICLSGLLISSRYFHIADLQHHSMTARLALNYGALFFCLLILIAATSFQRNLLKFVPVLIWAPLMFCAIICHIIEINQQWVTASPILLLHIINDALVSGTLIYLGYRVYQKERRIITCYADSVR